MAVGMRCWRSAGRSRCCGLHDGENVSRRSAGRLRGFGALRMGTREVSVPAVSMARRRVDRLRAANIAAAPWKFARKLARPPSCVRIAWIQSESFRPYCFLVRAGRGTDGGFGQFAVLLLSSGVYSVEPRRPNAAAAACRLSLPFRLFELHSAIQIRSEVSAPALMRPRYLDTIRELSYLLFSGSGGRGLRTDALGNSRCSCPVRARARLNRVHCSSLNGFELRRALPAPAKEP